MILPLTYLTAPALGVDPLGGVLRARAGEVTFLEADEARGKGHGVFLVEGGSALFERVGGGTASVYDDTRRNGSRGKIH
jgi:hypothetical protein